MKFAAVFAALVAVAAAAPTTSWTLNDLSNAIQNPATPASLLPYLEHALGEMMHALFSGQNMDSIAIITPGGVLPVEAVFPIAEIPADVDPTPVAVAPVAPAAPTPAPTLVNDAAGNPLVQIIVNINAQSQDSVAAPTPVPAPVVDAEMEPEAVYEPLPLPPVVTPEAVYEPQPLPVVVAPEVPDSVAIIPVVPGTNPIDLLQPTPVAVAGAGQ